MHGIYVIDKPKSLSSQKVLNSLKGIFKTKRIGHLGTLDPFATGVLPVFVGEMTKLIPYCEDSRKSYLAELKLGEETDTLDCTGEVISISQIPEINKEQILKVMSSLMGRRLQKAPLYSAIKIAGRPLYSYARKDKAPEGNEEVRNREIEIFKLQLVDYQKPYISFFCEVSRGTYVRSLGLEIAEALGSTGHLNNLRRTQSGLFSEAQAIKPEDLQEASSDFILKQQIPLRKIFSQFDHQAVSSEIIERMMKGQWLKPDEVPFSFSERECFLYENDELKIIAQWKEKNNQFYLVPVRGLHASLS